MEASTSLTHAKESTENMVTEDISVEIHELEEESEEEVFIIPSSVCPKTPDSKTFNKFHDRFGKQCCSTPLTTPKLTPLLGKISEEDLSTASTSESSVVFGEVPSSPKSEKNTFQVVLALAMLLFLFGFLCGFYLSSPKKEVEEKGMMGLTTNEEDELFVGQSYASEDESQKYVLLEKTTQWAVGNVSKRRLDENYRFHVNQLSISGSESDMVLANHIAEKWKHSGFHDTIQGQFTVTVSVPDTEKPSSIKMVNKDGTIILCQHLYGNGPEQNVDECATDMLTPEFEGSTSTELSSNASITTVITTNQAPNVPKHPLKWSVPDFVPFSQSRLAQGQLVYVHFGTQDDFNTITRMKIDPIGKIALIRNGNKTIHEQILNAEAHGVAGLLLYNDPADNLNLPTISSSFDVTGIMGDPFSPTNGIFHTTKDDTNIPKIPVHIINSELACKLLSHLEGKKAPAAWQGRFSNVTYHVGKKKNSGVLLKLEINNGQEVVAVNNVIATIKGKLYPDEIILIGSYRTSFPDNIQSALSSVSMATELASVIGQLSHDGWQPDRTIMLCSWGAHEYGFSGSVSWMQKHKASILQSVVAYIDINAILGLNGINTESSLSLRHLVSQISKKLGVHVNIQEKLLVLDGDHAPYSHHIGIPSLKISAGLPTNKLTHIPSLQVTTQFLAHVAVTLCDSVVLPYDLETFVDEMVKYYRTLETQHGEYLSRHNVSLDILKHGINKLSEVVNSLQQTTAVNDMQSAHQINRKMMKLKTIFIEENNGDFIRNMLLGKKSNYSTFPRLTELLKAPDISIMQIRNHLSRLIFAFNSATEVLAW